jgi:hypothetical protein
VLSTQEWRQRAPVKQARPASRTINSHIPEQFNNASRARSFLSVPGYNGISLADDVIGWTLDRSSLGDYCWVINIGTNINSEFGWRRAFAVDLIRPTHSEVPLMDLHGMP